MNNNRGYNQNNSMNMNNMNYNDVSNTNSDTAEDMYPEVYHKLIPVVDQIIKEMERKSGNIYLTPDLLNQMTDEASNRFGTDAVTPVQNDMNTDAIPTMREFRPVRYGGGYWRGYDRGALSDIAKILFLQQIFGRRRPYWRWR